MLRHLLITRHAQSGWEAATDHERTLTAQGVKQAHALAQLLRERGWQPERMVCSTAQRATHTAQLLHEALGVSTELVRMKSLYEAGFEAVCHAVSSNANGAARVMVVAHNPTMSNVASRLAGKQLSLSTATCVALSRQAESWDDALAEAWTLDALLRPSVR